MNPLDYDPIESQEAYQNIDSTNKKLNETTQKVNEVYKELRSSSQDFYYRISLLSGGIISLSITYIGYLSSIPDKTLAFAELLFGGWILLVISLFSSLYRNFFYSQYGHWQVLGDLNEDRLKSEEALLHAVSNFPYLIANLKGDEVKRQKEIYEGNITKIKDAISSNKVKEKSSEWFWLNSQKISHITFLLGIILILVFAAVNLPIQPGFTMFDWLRNINF